MAWITSSTSPARTLPARELAALLDHIPATRQLVVNMTSSSGGSIESLRKPNRVVIAATKTGTEKNATVFARYWAEALRDPAADTDKNEAVSALEAFRYAAAQDHGVLRYRRSAWPPNTPCWKTPARAKASDALGRERRRQTGGRVSPWCGWAPMPPPRATPPSAPLLEKKEQLEQAIDKLKYEKAAMPADEYKKQLTQLLLELAADSGGPRQVRTSGLVGNWRGCRAALFALALPGADSGAGRGVLESAALPGSQRGLRALVAQHPKNRRLQGALGPAVSGSLSARRCRRTSSTKRSTLNKDRAGALLGLALVAADDFGARPRTGAQGAGLDPKLLEAQELLARLALEDNDNAKAAEEAKKALAMDPNSVQAKAVLASYGLAGGQEGDRLGPARRPRL